MTVASNIMEVVEDEEQFSEESEDDEQLGESEEENSELSDGELQDAFSKGLLKPGLNVPTKEPKKIVNNTEGLKQCLADFSKTNLPWVERLDLVNLPAEDIVAKAEGRLTDKPSGEINADDDFQREMFFYRQAQAAVLDAMPRLLKLKIATKRPDDYFAEMAKTDQQMQKIRKKLIMKQAIMEKSEKAKKLREQRKYGKQVQVEVIQKRQKEKKAMMTSVKKYQKGMTDKLDFLDDKNTKGAGKGPGAAKGPGAGQAAKNQKKKGPNAKRKFKDERFGFGGKKSGTKWNTKDSHNDVSGFKARTAHGKGGGKGGKGAKGGKGRKGGPGKGGKQNKRPGKTVRQKMKGRS